jgi:flagellar protein FlaG
MAINVNLQSVSPETVIRPSVALRQSQIALENNSDTKVEVVQQTQQVRQNIAVQQQQKAGAGQNLAEAKKMVVQLKEQTQSVSRQLEFRVDENSGRTLIKVTDRETGELIREIPSEEMVELGQRLRELAETLHSRTESSRQNSNVVLTGLLVKRQA